MSYLTSDYLDYIQPHVITEQEMFLKINTLINEGIIAPEKVVNISKKMIPQFRKTLIKNGINVKPLEMAARSLSKTVVSSQKAGKTPEQTAKIIQTQTIKAIKQAFKNADKKLLIKQSIIAGLIMIGLSLYFQVLILEILTLLGLTKPLFLVSVIIGPLIEEIAKAAIVNSKGIKGNVIIATSVFAGFELINFTAKAIINGRNLPRFLIIRTITALIHMTTAYVQKYFKDNYEEQEMQILGFCIALMIHIFYNIIVIKFDYKIAPWISAK